jgi:hypothetical protein
MATKESEAKRALEYYHRTKNDPGKREARLERERKRWASGKIKRDPEKGRIASLKCYHKKRKVMTQEEKDKANEYQKKWRDENKDKINLSRKKKRLENLSEAREKGRLWDLKNPHKKMFNGARHRANKNNLEFNITLDDIMPLPTHCPVLGTELRKGISSSDSHSYSLDRVDNTKGYIKGNVAVISARANRLKRDGTLEEFEKLVKWLKT